MSSLPTYEDLVAEALQAHFRGWDFSWLQGRADGGDPSWSYLDRCRRLIAKATSLLDIDTGGGERLAHLAPLPPHTVATEGWEPNLPVARARLGPLGVEVRHQDGGRLPVGDAEFDLVLNRHGRLEAGEIRRALRTGGVLLTQQVGSRNARKLNEALGDPVSTDVDAWSLEVAVAALQRQGFRILDAREELPEHTFYDIGAVVYQLRAVAWQIPDFDVERYDAKLRALDARIRANGCFVVHDHRFLIKAQAD
jgi:SAM-dependent methyltransferase